MNYIFQQLRFWLFVHVCLLMVCTGLETNNAFFKKKQKQKKHHFTIPTTSIWALFIPSFMKVRVSFNYELTQPLISFREREIHQYSWPWKHGFELHGSTYTQIFFNSKPDGTIRSTAGWIHGCGTVNRKDLTIQAICECVESQHPHSPHCSRLHYIW